MTWRVGFGFWAGLTLSGASANEDEFRQFRESYGLLHTVAGNGEADEGNDWRA
jgi:hypothetical protein